MSNKLTYLKFWLLYFMLVQTKSIYSNTTTNIPNTDVATTIQTGSNTQESTPDTQVTSNAQANDENKSNIDSKENKEKDKEKKKTGPDEKYSSLKSECPPAWTTTKDVRWINNYIRSMSKKYPKVTKLVQIGYSVKNKPLYAFEIVHSIHTGGVVVIDAGMDSTDRMGVNLALYMLHQFVEKLSDNISTVMALKFCILPLANPDEYENVLAELKAKPCRENLAQNFDSASNTGNIRCPKQFTEPETKAIRDYYTALGNIKLYVSLNSGRSIIAFPHSYNNNETQPQDNVVQMARNMKNVVDASEVNADLVVSSMRGIFGQRYGSPVDWIVEQLKVPYSLYVSLDRRSLTPFTTMENFYEAFRYAVLQVQLTEPDVALAIYNDCSSARIFRYDNPIILCFLVLLSSHIYFV